MEVCTTGSVSTSEILEAAEAKASIVDPLEGLDSLAEVVEEKTVRSRIFGVAEVLKERLLLGDGMASDWSAWAAVGEDVSEALFDREYLTGLTGVAASLTVMGSGIAFLRGGDNSVT